jgi:hypothetical protein
MVIYTCPNCLKKFNRKSNYDYHIENKKKPCRANIPKYSEIFPNIPKYSENSEVLDDLRVSDQSETPDQVSDINICDYCNKSFSTKFNLNKHIKHNCKLKKQQDEENKVKDTQLVELMKKLEEQSKKIEEQSKKIEELSKNPKNINNNIVLNNNNSINTTNTTNTNTNNIKLVAHGSEDMSNFDIETVLKYLCSVELFDIIPDAVRDVYLNDSKPENKNFRVTDMSRNKSEFYDGKNWIVGKADEKIMKIFEGINDKFIEPFIGDNLDKTMSFINRKKDYRERLKAINSGRHFCRSLYSETDKEAISNRNTILDELKLLFYNNRDNILNC